MLKTIKHFACVIILLSLLAACSSRKEAAPGSTAYIGTREAVATLVADADAPWSSLSIPVSVKIDDSGLPTLSGTMTMIRDSEIRLSVRFLGMEVGAARVTNDSVYAFAKLQKVYVAESVRDLLGGFPATVGNLQALLLDRLFVIGQSSPSGHTGTVSDISSGTLSITPRSPSAGMAYTFEASLEPPRVTSVTFTGGTRRAEVRYGVPGSRQDIGITARSGNRNLSATVTLNLSKARWDGDDTLRPFSIPSGSRRLSASSLLRSLRLN